MHDMLLLLIAGLQLQHAAHAADTVQMARPIAVAAALEQGSPAIDSAWPGFWPQEHVYAIAPPGKGAVVISTKQGGIALAPLPEDSVPAVLRGRAFFSPEPVAEGILLPMINADYRAGGERMFAATLYVPMVPYTDSTTATIYHFLHEAFHVHQWAVFSDKIPPTTGVERHGPAPASAFENDGLAVITTPAFQRRLEGERNALREAVLATTPDARRSAIRRYYAERNARFDSTSSSFPVGETMGERLEGTATYVGMRGVAAAMRTGANGLRDAIVSGLERPYWPQYEAQWQYGHWHVYAVGAAKSWLLDAEQPNWRSEVAAGAGLDQLILKAYRLQP